MKHLNDNLKEFPERIIDNNLYCNIAKSKDIAEGKGYRFDFADDDDMQIAVFRVNHKLYCLFNICPHRHQDRIYEALINFEKLTITCPLHFWTYSLETGDNINQKQGIKNLIKYDIFEEDGEIWVEKPPLNIPKWRRLQETDEDM